MIFFCMSCYMSKLSKVLLSLLISVSAGNAMNDNKYQTNDKRMYNLYPQDLSNGIFTRMNNLELGIKIGIKNDNKLQYWNSSTLLDIFNNTPINNTFTPMNNINQSNINFFLLQNFPLYPRYPLVSGNQINVLNSNNFTNSTFLQRNRNPNTSISNIIEQIKMTNGANNYNNIYDIPNNYKILPNNLSNYENSNKNNIDNFISKNNDINANTIKLNYIKQEKDNNINILLNQNKQINEINNQGIMRNINKLQENVIQQDNNNLNYSNISDNNPRSLIINLSEQDDKSNNNDITNILKENTTLENVVQDITAILNQYNITNITENTLKEYIILVCNTLQNIRSDMSEMSIVQKRYRKLESITKKFFKKKHITIDAGILKDIRLIVYKSTRLYQHDNEEVKRYYRKFKTAFQKRARSKDENNTNQCRDKQKSRDALRDAQMKLMQIYCKENNVKYDRGIQRAQLQKYTRNEAVKSSENALTNEQLEAFKKLSHPYLDIFKKEKNSLFNTEHSEILTNKRYSQLKQLYPSIEKNTLTIFIDKWRSRSTRPRVSKYDTKQLNTYNNGVLNDVNNEINKSSNNKNDSSKIFRIQKMNKKNINSIHSKK